MLEAFSAYIKNIAVFMLFAAFAEMLMPENNLKKYISLVMGLILLTIVIKPMFFVFQKGADLELKALQQAVSFWSEEYDIQNTENNQWNETMILNIYKKELEQKLQEDLQNKFHTNMTVTAQIDTQQKNYGDILAVTLQGEIEKEEEMREYMKKKYDIDQVYIEGS